MRQLNVFSKIFIASMVLFLLSGCKAVRSTDGTDSIQTEDITIDEETEAESEYNYSIAVVNTSALLNWPLPWKDEFSYNIIQIENMPDEFSSIQDTINDNLKEAMTSWVRGQVTGAEEVRLTVTCHSERYLSAYNEFVYISRRTDRFNDYVTIDMSSGQRVFLKDLVEINEEFAEFLRNNQDIIKEGPNSFWQFPPDLKKRYTTSELLEELNKCSYTQEEVIQEGYYPVEGSIGSLLFRNSFFVREGMLVITLYQGGDERFVTLDVDDIEDFLKVDKW